MFFFTFERLALKRKVGEFFRYSSLIIIVVIVIDGHSRNLNERKTCRRRLGKKMIVIWQPW